MGIVYRSLLDDCGVTSLFVGKSPRSFADHRDSQTVVGEPIEEAIMMNNVELVKSLYAAFTRGDLDTIFAACDPNIEWISNFDLVLIPWGGERKGIDGARSFFKEVAAHVDYEFFQPRDFSGGSDFVTTWPHDCSHQTVRRSSRRRMDTPV